MAKLTFYDLLGVSDAAGAVKRWPRSRIQPTRGTSFGSSEYTDLVEYLQAALEFSAVRPGASTERVGLSAEVSVKNPPRPKPLVLRQMPDVETYLLDTESAPARIFVTVADTGLELVVEALPVEIRVPGTLLGPLRNSKKGDIGGVVKQAGPFEAGRLDSLAIELRDDASGTSSIFVHVRLRMTEERDFILEPAVPISIGPCRFVGLPCRGLHDLQLIPSPRLTDGHSEGEQALEWARHRLDRLSSATYPGLVAVRTVDLDATREPLDTLTKKLNNERKSDSTVEFVLEDIALPFFNLGGLPIPSHGLLGLRRRIELGDAPEEAFALSKSPVSLGAGRLLIDRVLLKSPAKPSDTFLFFDMAIWPLSAEGKIDKTWGAGTISVGDDWTIQFGFRLSTGWSLLKVADATLSVWGFKLGMSVKRTVDPEDYRFGDFFQVLFDLGLKILPTGKGAFKMRTLSGKTIELVLRDVGWDLGEFRLDGIEFPEGVQFVFADTISLVVMDVSLVTENSGGRYISFSGGVFIKWLSPARKTTPGQVDGFQRAALQERKVESTGIVFQRLRFRYGGNASAAPWLLDGIAIAVHLGTLSITGFGVVSEYTLDDHEYKEFGFGIQVEFDALATRFLIGMQLLYGNVRGGSDDFSYMLLAFQYSPIPFSVFSLINLRFLFASNMAPNLPPPDGRDQNMRLFRWYRSTKGGAITLQPNRKLAAWKRTDDAWAAGAGLGIELAASVVFFDAFLFIHKSPGEFGLFVALEAYLLKGKTPVGYGVFEIDFARDKWGLLIGIAAGLEHVIGRKIPVLSKLLALNLTGTLYFGNKPATVALGQLNDQSTWLALRFSVDVFVYAKLMLGLCVQIVDGPDGPKGFGLALDVKAGADFGIGKVRLWLAFGLIAGSWRNESMVSGFVMWFDAGVQIKLFWIFTLGASVKIEFHYLGPDPTFRNLACLFRVETPWFLPDVSFRAEYNWDEPRPEKMDAISTPLIGAGAESPAKQTREEIAVTALPGIGERDVFDVETLHTLPAPELDEGALAKLTPVGVDSAIALDYQPSMDDKLKVGESTPPGAGTQKATPPAKGDLSVTYELITAEIQRRPRFRAGTWSPLIGIEDTRLQSPADLPKGADVTAYFISVVDFQWNRDMLRDGALDPRQLLINARRPYSIVIRNPEADEATARSDPGWPCCGPKSSPAWHELDFHALPLGRRAPAVQRFSESASTLHWIGAKPPVVAFGHAAPAGVPRARLHLDDRGPGVIAAVSFDEPVSICEMHLYWPGASAGSELIVGSYDGLDLLAERAFPLDTACPMPPIRLESENGMTSLVVRLVRRPGDQSSGDPAERMDWIELESMRYRSVSEELDRIGREQKCRAREARALGHTGVLAWLPNHDYEITVTSKVLVRNSRTETQEGLVKQKAYFRTKGLTGLNAVERIGDELEPYVESFYPGPSPRRLYRSEPVAIAFNEDFNFILPVDRVPSTNDPEERQQILEWTLAVEKLLGNEGQRISQTSPDWIGIHRKVPPPPEVWMAAVSDAPVAVPLVRKAVSEAPLTARFEAMLMRPNGCEIPGPILHSSQVLFHRPVNPAATEGDERRRFWDANEEFRVNVRQKGGPFVERTPFLVHDETAFNAAGESGASGATWRSIDGAMRLEHGPSGGARHYAIFGEHDWDHVQIHVIVDPEGARAGIALSVNAGASVSRAMIVLVDGRSSALQILARRGGQIATLASRSLPAGTSAPYALEVLAYDDRLRARVGDLVVEADREAFRAGRLALLAQGGGVFSSLVVEGLDAYRFHFRSSRFEDFEAHIASFDGELTVIPMDAGGAARATVASLFSADAAKIEERMRPGADPELRQRLFDRWVSELALPLREDVRELHLSRCVSDAGTELFVLESPEPLPFTEDVALNLSKRVLAPEGCLTAMLKPVTNLVKLVSPGLSEAERVPPELIGLADGLDFSTDEVAGPVSSEAMGYLVAAPEQVVHAVEGEDGLELHVYDVRVESPRRGSYRLSGRRREVLRPENDRDRTHPLVQVGSTMRAEEIALMDVDGKMVAGNRIKRAQFQNVDIVLKVLADGDEARALLLPMSPGNDAPQVLTPGRYRFEFRLDRFRFRTNTPDEASSYGAHATIVTDW